MDRFATLTAFVAVADHRGFAAAARALGISPPAVTRAVAALEQHLGISLFHRSTRAVSLTDEGATFLDRARRILADLREAEQVAMGLRSIPRGQLYVTAPEMFGRLHVLPAINELLARHDGLSARMMLLDRNVRIVEEGIDVAVRIGTLPDSSLRVVPIGSVRQIVVASPDYLVRRGTPSEPGDLRNHACIVGNSFRLHHVWSFGPKQETVVDITPRLTVNTVEATIAAAVDGLGFTHVLSYQVAEQITAGRLVEVLADSATPPLPVNLLYEAGRTAIPAVRAFVDAMRDRSKHHAWA